MFRPGESLYVQLRWLYMYIMQLCHKCMDHGNKCIIVPHNAKQNEMTILIGCKSYTTGATNTSGPETAPLSGHPISCCSISSFLHSALLFIVCPLVLFFFQTLYCLSNYDFCSFRHCIVCQTMTFFFWTLHYLSNYDFFLLDILLSVKL